MRESSALLLEELVGDSDEDGLYCCAGLRADAGMMAVKIIKLVCAVRRWNSRSPYGAWSCKHIVIAVADNTSKYNVGGWNSIIRVIVYYCGISIVVILLDDLSE